MTHIYLNPNKWYQSDIQPMFSSSRNIFDGNEDFSLTNLTVWGQKLFGEYLEIQHVESYVKKVDQVYLLEN